MKIDYSFLIISLLFLFIHCDNAQKKSLKAHPEDPFIESMVESQYFELDAKEDHVIEGRNGTILVLPKGCFVDKNGKIIKENIKVELAEALDLEEMILSNLTTTSNGSLLETDGMVFINATQNGEELEINPKIPIRIEIPTTKRKNGMMAYKGVRDQDGNMNWVEPKKIENYLISVDINLLNFYPDEFEETVVQGMPFRGHQEADRALTDSLYYSFSVESQAPLIQEGVPTELNEPYYNQQKKVVDGKYTDDSYKSSLLDQLTDSVANLTDAGFDKHCGIDPASIKVIKGDAYQNTLIATREFEQRLRIIFESCRNDLLGIYVQNLDKNLYELDSMAAVTLGEHGLTHKFYDFYQQHLTNVKEADKYAELLKGHYEKRLKETKKQLKKIQQKAVKELERKNKVAQKLVNEYKEVLRKREKQRMETYGFEWTSTGWVNVDIGVIPKDWGSKPLSVKVIDGSYYDHVFTYVVYPSINSIYRLNSSDKENFYVGNAEQREMLMPKKSKAVTISIAYKNELQFLAIKDFITGDTDLNLSLDKTSKQAIKEALRPYNKFSKENRIDKDLVFMEKLAKEKKRQEALRKDQAFINQLYAKVYSCCDEETTAKNGRELFRMYCSSCHSTENRQLVGPGLAYTTSTYPMDWIIRFTQNSLQMVNEGDKRAVEVYNKYNKVIMPAQPVSDKEVKAIFEYIDGLNKFQ